MSGLVYGGVWILFNSFARIFFCFRVKGYENFPPTGGVIVAANHASYLDIPLLGCAIRRRVYYLGRANLFPHPWWNWILQKLGWIPLKTHRLDRKGFGMALHQLNCGFPVVIFPEGSRTKDGKLLPGRPGIGYLVAESGCQVIPTFISGTFKVLPEKAIWPKWSPVSVSFGKPIAFREDSSQGSKVLYEHISRVVMEGIAEVGKVTPPH